MISYLTRNVDDRVVQRLFQGLETAELRFNYLCLAFQPEHAVALQAMSYDDFLKTTYWIVIRNYLFATRDRCCYKCSRGGLLVLHHLNYEHHGYEHEHLDELVFLCRECHEENHKPIDALLKKLLDILIQRERQVKLPEAVKNPNYDPRTLMNLHDYGDIRGRIDE